jgi:N-formylglutamate deformylase
MLWSERTVWPYRYCRGFTAHRVDAACRDLRAHSVDATSTKCRMPLRHGLASAAALRFPGELDATVIVANLSRYVIDVNRPPDGANLYPGRDTPKLCPTDTFDQRPLYRDEGPSEGEIARRLDSVWQPYQHRLEREIARVRAQHGIAVLWDAHSIVSVAPRLFEGKLPFQSRHGGRRVVRPSSLRASLAALESIAISATCERPLQGRLHHAATEGRRRRAALQLEMAECIYMQESSPTHSVPRARMRTAVLREQLATAIDWAVNH